MRDIVLFSATVVAFAVLLTCHGSILLGLSRRSPRWRALVALPLAPLAPYWALREGMRGRTAVWVTSLVVYVATVLAQRG